MSNGSEAVTALPQDELAEIRALFFEECVELLEALDRHIVGFEAGAVDPEAVNAAFRAVHSIKGGAGAFALQSLIGFAHAYENVLEAARSQRLDLTPEIALVLRRGADRLADHVAAARDAEAAPQPDHLEDELVLLAGSEQEADLAELFPAACAATPASPPPPCSPKVVTFVLRPARDLFRRRVDLPALLGRLRGLGRLSVTTDVSALPSLAELDPGDCWLSFRAELETELPPSELEAVLAAALLPGEFEFAELNQTVDALEASPAPAHAEAPTASPPAVQAKAPKASPPPAHADQAPRRGEPSAPAKAALPATTATPVAASIRVETARIDRLVNLVGEIVVVQSLLAEQMAQLDTTRHGLLLSAIGSLSRRSRELHEAVMAVRAQPVRTVFQRMPRLVRELGQTLGKEVRLVLEGEETEVDKAIIEELAEPLTHMLRNAMDHGLEPAAERVATGKPPEGRLLLAAEHRGERIVITLADDGRGIDRGKLLAKAVERGLVADGARMQPEEIDALIFHPGLSTADKLSDISGRGVGMDVVQRSVQALGGRISVTSEPGRGCRFTLAMPLTLAVLDGMVVRAGNERYVLPLGGIVETLRAAQAAVERLPSGPPLLRLRGQLSPLYNLEHLLDKSAQGRKACEGDGIIIIAETDKGERIGLIADEILGQQQVVVKSLERSFGRIGGVSGASILGDGRVSLILDVDALPALLGETAAPRAAWQGLASDKAVGRACNRKAA